MEDWGQGLFTSSTSMELEPLSLEMLDLYHGRGEPVFQWDEADQLFLKDLFSTGAIWDQPEAMMMDDDVETCSIKTDDLIDEFFDHTVAER